MPFVRAELALKLQASIAERAKANQVAVHGNEFKVRRKGFADISGTYRHAGGDRQGGGTDIVSASAADTAESRATRAGRENAA